ncbi:DUF4149 domain-containing protein [Paludisphaera borealis]|uniref:TMEM205-like domain-containing protein n=1 Tax=Paludisphaera borealis TaxID=1387353 RepID=A0A1U7CZ07_9BACT|nr:DUF4149 domain-containing protein [Paludisphaera borealis]APW64190.1 hypothetical protein BSF38_05782 [Paludisphaera borealis]
MSAHFLLGIFDSIYLLALAAWTGEILFFSFAVAPIVFSTLGVETGERFVRALFPRYYAWGATAGAIALPAFIAGPLCYPEFRGPRIGVQAMLILGAILLTLYSGNSLTPAINAARDEGPSGDARFRRLHFRSVVLNVLVLVVGIGLLVAFANRPAPRTSGIIEPSPVERVQREANAAHQAEPVDERGEPREPREDSPRLVDPKL